MAAVCCHRRPVVVFTRLCLNKLFAFCFSPCCWRTRARQPKLSPQLGRISLVVCFCQHLTSTVQPHVQSYSSRTRIQRTRFSNSFQKSSHIHGISLLFLSLFLLIFERISTSFSFWLMLSSCCVIFHPIFPLYSYGKGEKGKGKKERRNGVISARALEHQPPPESTYIAQYSGVMKYRVHYMSAPCIQYD